MHYYSNNDLFSPINFNTESSDSLQNAYINFHRQQQAEYQFNRKLEQMEKRITENVIKEVLARLSVEADVSDAVLNIKELQDAINNLTKGGK